MYFDSHAHYDDEQFASDREELLSSLWEAGVEGIVNAACDLNSCYESIRLAETYPQFYAAIGIHPHEVTKTEEAVLLELKRLASHKKVVAIGEIGLDYHYEEIPRDLQKQWFDKQLSLAEETALPVIIHSREAAQDCFERIKKSSVRRGVIHCYSGSPEMALEYVKLGFFIGIGGVLTYKNAVKTVETARAVPLNRILIETDAPYLSPVPNRGKRNDSRNLQYVIKKLAEITGNSTDFVANCTKNNALKLFQK